jgi:hemerythrin-like domain-containing protein
MKRDEALRELSRDHHQALYRSMRMKRAGQGDVDDVRADVLGFWRDHGARHFRIEEEILLPGFATAGDPSHEALVRVLVDHVWIRERMERLAADELDVSAIHQLGDRLDAHVRHEERVLFPLIEDALDADAPGRARRANRRRRGALTGSVRVRRTLGWRPPRRQRPGRRPRRDSELAEGPAREQHAGVERGKLALGRERPAALAAAIDRGEAVAVAGAAVGTVDVGHPNHHLRVP